MNIMIQRIVILQLYTVCTLVCVYCNVLSMREETLCGAKNKDHFQGNVTFG